LPYVGGKSNIVGPGNWIAGWLETCEVSTYVEPCCGCLGILLRRNPVSVEVCNDIDGRIINFFRVIRDQPDKFAHKLRLTCMRSESEFIWAKNALDNGDDVMRAIAVFVVLKNSIPASLIARSSYVMKSIWGNWTLPDDVYRLADRLNGVRFINKNMDDVIAAYVDKSNTLIYIDPPYPGTLGYDNSIERRSFIRLVTQAQRRAYIAISGFQDSWPELLNAGFTRYDRKIHLQMDTSKTGARIESIYLYSPYGEWIDQEKPYVQNILIPNV